MENWREQLRPCGPWSMVHSSEFYLKTSQPKGTHSRYFISSKATTSIFLRRALTVQTYPSCSLTRTHTLTHARTLYSHDLFLPPSLSLSLSLSFLPFSEWQVPRWKKEPGISWRITPSQTVELLTPMDMKPSAPWTTWSSRCPCVSLVYSFVEQFWCDVARMWRLWRS